MKRFGARAQEALGSIAGFEVDSNNVAAFDIVSAEVVIWDADLNVLHRFGREGRGPGEFENRSSPIRDALGITATTISVLDTRRLQQFDRDGRFLNSTFSMSKGGVKRPYNTRLLHTIGADLYYVTASQRGDTAHMAVRRLREGSDSQMVERPAWVLPTVRGGRTYGGPGQADLLFAARGGCIYFHNGAKGPLYRFDATSNSLDSVALPQIQMPPDQPAVEGSGDDAERLRSLGIDLPDGEFSGPTAPEIWKGMSVDPDGHIWLKPWDQSGSGVDIIVFNPSTGDVKRLRSDFFPQQFGTPPSAYAASIDPDFNFPIVVKLQPVETGK